MCKSTKIVFILFLFLGILVSSVSAYDFPKRKIEIKPYLSLFFPNDIGEWGEKTTVVGNKADIGLGLKLRTQFTKQFGLVLNTSYNRFDVPDNVSNEGIVFTGGGYFEKSYGFGDLTFDLSYGIIIAADAVAGLLMPSIEYSKPISDRTLIAFEFGLPIPNDWPKDYGYKESFGSMTLSAGTIFIF